MNINTIILIDKNQEIKQSFIEKLKQKINFSYTKIEALFQAINEMSDKESIEQYLKFLDKFLNNLSDKRELYLIDADNLSAQNANKLIKEHDNIIIIYLKKGQDEIQTIQINGDNEKEIDSLIEELVKRLELWKN